MILVGAFSFIYCGPHNHHHCDHHRGKRRVSKTFQGKKEHSVAVNRFCIIDRFVCNIFYINYSMRFIRFRLTRALSICKLKIPKTNPKITNAAFDSGSFINSNASTKLLVSTAPVVSSPPSHDPEQ
jgi:hypothetical protein